MTALPMWAPEIPAVGWYQDGPGQTGLEAWAESGGTWQEFPASLEQAQEILGRPAPTWEHLSSAELLEVAKTVTEAAAKAARKNSRKKTTHDDAPAEPDQPQEAAEHDDPEGENG